MPPYVWMPQDLPYFQTPPHVPNASLYICMFWGYLHVIGGCGGPHSVWTPMCLDASPYVQHPPAFICFPASLYVLLVIACIMGETSNKLGAGGFSTSVRLLVSVSTSIGYPLCFVLYLFSRLPAGTESDWQARYYPYSSIHSYPPQCGSQLSVLDWRLAEWHLLPLVAQAAFHLWGLPEVDLLVSSSSSQCQHYYTFESPLPLGTLELNAFNHPGCFR